jgi:hypothetical protein
LIELLANGGWSEARTYQAPRGSDEIRSWRRIRCTDGRVGVVARVMPVELWDDDYYEEPRWLSGGEVEALEAAIRLPAVPRELKYLPDADPDTEPCSPETKERLLADFDAFQRRYRFWRNAVLIVAGIVLVCMLAVLVRRL